MKHKRTRLIKTEYWEDGRPPTLTKVSSRFVSMLREAYRSGVLEQSIRATTLSYDELQLRQFERIKYLVRLAYKIPLYHEKYRAAGFLPEDLKSWEDYHRLPCVTKDELIDAFPNRCVNPDFYLSDLFTTRSSGSSGKTLRIVVDPKAIIIDTIQGIRQFWLQTGGNYYPDDLVAHVYTVPWWVDSIDGDYQSIFISSLISPSEIAQILDEICPDILSLYPSNLSAILPYLSKNVKLSLKLVVVHSELSSALERHYYSDQLGCPVLDEYSSEELTRIALELPCGHYHLCEDTVRVDVLDNKGQPITNGIGTVCATNLLNEAMPFIRYLQDDLVEIRSTSSCELISWRQLASIQGRSNDPFVTPSGRVVPAGTLLDITYRWMFDTNINVREFEVIQITPHRIKVNLVEPLLQNHPEMFAISSKHFMDLVRQAFGEEVDIEFQIVSHLDRKGKRRPIRREF